MQLHMQHQRLHVWLWARVCRWNLPNTTFGWTVFALVPLKRLWSLAVWQNMLKVHPVRSLYNQWMWPMRFCISPVQLAEWYEEPNCWWTGLKQPDSVNPYELPQRGATKTCRAPKKKQKERRRNMRNWSKLSWISCDTCVGTRRRKGWTSKAHTAVGCFNMLDCCTHSLTRGLAKRPELEGFAPQLCEPYHSESWHRLHPLTSALWVILGIKYGNYNWLQLLYAIFNFYIMIVFNIIQYLYNCNCSWWFSVFNICYSVSFFGFVIIVGGCLPPDPARFDWHGHCWTRWSRQIL